MREQPKINIWALKDKEKELRLLSDEISKWFSISKKIALKLINDESINSLEKLKIELTLLEKNDEVQSINEVFDEEKLEKLFFSLKWAREVIENASKSEINELKELLEKTDLFDLKESDLIRKIFSKKIIEKAKNPKDISDQILWFSLWIASSTIIITEILYSLWKWIITSVSDLISVLKWEWEIESIKKV